MNNILNIVSQYHNDWIRIVKSFGEHEYYEDIVQEMYIKVHNNRNKDVWFKNEQLNKNYIFSILHNITYDLRQQKKKIEKVDLTNIENLADIDLNFEIEQKELNLLIQSEIDSWDFYDQKMYEVYTIHEKSIRKIHKATGISIRSIHTTITNCKNRIINRVKTENICQEKDEPKQKY